MIYNNWIPAQGRNDDEIGQTGNYSTGLGLISNV